MITEEKNNTYDGGAEQRSTKLEKAYLKLKRIQKEQHSTIEAIREEHEKIPFGQPNIQGRRDIYKDIKRQYEKSRKLVLEENKQVDRIEMLGQIEKFKKENELLKDVHVVGSSEFANVGAKTSVNNLDYFRNKLAELEEENEKAKAYNRTKPIVKKKTLGTEITKLKRKILNLEAMEEKAKNTIMTEKTEALISSGAVNQWKKKPIYFFVKGLRKVALEIDEKGEFFISPSYPAYTEDDKEFIKNLLG
ncbi:hypothetical protein ACYRFS_13040 [Listeria kieliensis]